VRWVLKRRKGDLATIATHAKLGIAEGRMGKSLSYPMKGITVRAQNIHVPKAVNIPSRIKRVACNRERSARL
jgi:hypothetical protein